MPVLRVIELCQIEKMIVHVPDGPRSDPVYHVTISVEFRRLTLEFRRLLNLG